MSQRFEKASCDSSTQEERKWIHREPFGEMGEGAQGSVGFESETFGAAGRVAQPTNCGPSV